MAITPEQEEQIEQLFHVTIRRRLQTTEEYVSPAEFAILLAAMSEKEAAFQSLSRACAAHDFQLQYLKVDPGFDSLRSDLRFQVVAMRCDWGA